jgi:parallel beta-helix repeat protein
MNIRISLQQLKGLFLIKALFAFILAAPSMASAIEIKATNYPIPAGAYFVSPNGKDTNTGKSYDSPLSVKKAIASAPSGSTIVFKGGIYRNVTTGINRKLTLQAYPHEQPWLKGSIEVKDWVADGATWRKDNWTYSLPVVKETYITPDYPMARYTDMVYVNGVSLKQVANKASVVPGTFYVDKANNKLYIGNNPANKTVESTVLPNAFRMWKNRSSDPSNTVIRGLGFAHYAQTSIFVGAPNVTLENNTFAWNGEQGVTFGNNAYGGGSDARVRGNIFSYNGRNGLGGLSHRILIEQNTISYNNIERFRKTWDAAGVKFIKSHGSVFRNNIVENNFATGIWFDASCLNTTIANNTSRSNESIGIQYELSHKAFVTGNAVYNNGAGIMLADSSGSQVSNNTLGNNRYKEPIIVKDSPRKNTNSAEIALGITWIARNNTIANNSL